MRIKLDQEQRALYFGSLKSKVALQWPQIARTLQVEDRMLRSWRSGEYTLPKQVSQRIYTIYGVSLPPGVKILPEYWHIQKAGRKGALRRYELYGDLGTPEGRRLGGLHSMQSQILKGTKFVFRKKVTLPRRSRQLAELIGILIGDGGITYFQAKVSLGLQTDEQYSHYVKMLFDALFKIQNSLISRKDGSVIEVVVSSRSVVEFLVRCGLPIGDKIRHGITIPQWILDNSAWSKECLRGIFDTDGCVYLDRHRSKQGIYQSSNIAITSASPLLLDAIRQIFKREKFLSTISGRSIRLRKKADVIRFFTQIGSNNPKHRMRWEQFTKMEEYRSGYNGTASKAVV